MKPAFPLLAALLLAARAATADETNTPDLLNIPADLANPPVTMDPPAPGKMVLQWLPGYAWTEVAHALYLPTDWTPGRRFPVIIEYQGNTRRVRDGGGLGYGLSGGAGFIWAVLPYVGLGRQADTNWWWGDVGATVSYAKEAVPAICRQWGGDPSRVLLVGHSRGAIACNYIGLHDDEVAKLWRALMPVSHYDDAHTAWGMAPAEVGRAPERLRRLGRIPQLVCGEYTSKPHRGGDARLREAIAGRKLATFAEAKKELGLVALTEAEGTRAFIATNLPQGRITLIDLPYVNHTAEIVLRDVPERRQMRAWLQDVLRGDAPAKPMLFAAYYCWYHAPTNAQEPWLHWTYPASASNAVALEAQRPGEPPLNSAARPLAGFYDSSDAATAAWHVRLAQAAGVDAFLVDWWGEHRGLDQAVDRGIVAAVEKLGFRFALLDERAQFHAGFDEYAAMLTRALKRYKDRPAYLRIDGRPVVYLYQVAAHPGLTPDEFARLKPLVEQEAGPVYWIVDKIAHDPQAAQAGDEDRVKRIPADWLATPGVDAFGFYSTFSNFRAHRYEELAGKYRYLTALAHDAGKKMLLPVHPGHDNSHFVADPYVMPRRDGQTLRDFLRAATDAEADYVMVTSWNEWPETTVVEPSASWPDPYRYLKILAEWKGLRFTAPQVDLHDSSSADRSALGRPPGNDERAEQ